MEKELIIKIKNIALVQARSTIIFSFFFFVPVEIETIFCSLFADNSRTRRRVTAIGTGEVSPARRKSSIGKRKSADQRPGLNAGV